jgi:hypothetical protein
MSVVNYNDTTPAAPATGVVNIKWQSDASGNISAYSPIGNYQTWTPPVSGSGAMTVSISSLIAAQYLREGPILHMNLSLNLTLGGTLGSVVFIGIPVALFGPQVGFPCLLSSGSNFTGPALATFVNSSTLQVVQAAAANFPAGVMNFIITASYRVAA